MERARGEKQEVEAAPAILVQSQGLEGRHGNTQRKDESQRRLDGATTVLSKYEHRKT